MAEIVRFGQYDAGNLASVAFQFGQQGEDIPVLALLEQGVDPNIADLFGFTALHHAAQFDRPLLVGALLSAGADPERTTKLGTMPLMNARSSEVVSLLLQAGVDINAVAVANNRTFKFGATALMYAVGQDDIAVAHAFLENGADTRPRNESGFNALMLAAWNENNAMVSLLIDAGAEVGLLEAAMIGDYEKAQTLLAVGDRSPAEIETAFRWAAGGGHADVVTLFLNSGVSIDAPDEEGKTALMQAAQFGRIAVMHLLLERGSDPNAASRWGETALLASVQSDTGHNREAVELLLAHGARTDVCDHNGWTPLMRAACRGDKGVVPLLLRHEADPNAFTDAEAMAQEGCSTANALILAVRNGQREAVKWLLQYGADPLAGNNSGINALDAARQGVKRGDRQAEIREIIPMLEAGGQTTNPMPPDA